ncbi:hypothetical protein LSM04_003768 [Trypanosoma melophagium]|uniref:uncharacterized protein n=1 Tax=Trypanosoma melophagium TaxID=715481 RepID=UPI003519D9AA|nr:hypothetical protein LSM04_003768 [Trypanosoma melophagium]
MQGKFHLLELFNLLECCSRKNLAASSNMNTKNAKMVYQNFEKGNNRDNEQESQSLAIKEPTPHLHFCYLQLKCCHL